MHSYGAQSAKVLSQLQTIDASGKGDTLPSIARNNGGGIRGAGAGSSQMQAQIAKEMAKLEKGAGAYTLSAQRTLNNVRKK